jgi:hypothetical protein
MMTLLKYEIYRRWRWLVLRYAALIIIGAILLNRVSSPAYQYEFIGTAISKFVLTSGESIGKFVLTSLVIFMIIIVEGINMLKEDLFEECGYLTFTIPKKGRTILASKLVLLFLQLSFWTIISVWFGSIFFSKLPYREIAQIKTQINFYFFPTVLFILTAFFNSVLMIHFSLTLTKTLLVNKRYSDLLSIGIFFFLVYLIEKVCYGPLLNQIKNISIEIGSRSNIDLVSGGYTAVFLNIILIAIFFTATAYLLENKINI